VPLNVAVSPDVAPVVDGIAARFNKSKPKINDFCAEVRVSQQTSADVSGALLGGSSAPRPDVWIPDSSVWVDQARANSAQAKVPDKYTSIASSPVVIGMIAPTARQIGSAQVGWQRLLVELNNEEPLAIGLPEPTRNTTGMAAMLAIGQILAKSEQGGAKRVEVIRSISNAGAVTRTVQEAFDKLPKSQDSGAIASSVNALPATEQSVWRYNADNPAVPLQALYPSEGALRLDYPYVVTLNSPDEKREKAAQRFLEELTNEEARKDLQDNGFRTPDGAAGDVINPQAGVGQTAPRDIRKPAAAAVSQVLQSWRALALPTRMLVVMDVSGSMTQVVPGIGKTRMEVTLSAAQQGLGLLQDSSELGLWIFSTQLRGNLDHRELVPLGPLSQPVGPLTRRGAIGNALTNQVAAKPGGATGLYDSILAAFKSVKASYKPNKVNSVLIFTDGKNEDPTGGISLEGLIGQLKSLHDPQKPVPVFIVAFGPDTDVATARKIAEVTTGDAFQANNAGEITSVFQQAVGQRSKRCQPDCT
jgi:hypothetical protein